VAVPVQAAFGKGNKYFVFVHGDGPPRPTEVKLGLSSTEFVEITEGLKGGEKICLAVSDEVKLQLPEDTAEHKASKWSETRPATSQPTTTQPAGTQPATTQPATSQMAN
jgi:hypothetical protein